MKERTFYQNNFNYCEGGYFFRSELFKHIEKVEKDTGREVVGIAVKDWDVELLVKKE